ncbi:MAG: site-specific integrase [Thaumarchaeota archaeon]|nr:site-specific integrase [Nitrososphaerota archaeon]
MSSELVLQALVEMRIDGWKSGYASVDNVLRHLQRKSGGYGTPSYASVEWYAPILNAFCNYVGKDPDQLVSLPKEEIEELIHSYLDAGLLKGLSKTTIKNRRSCLLMHFKKNGYRGQRELEIEVYPVPARYRKMLEYIPNSGEVLAMADSAKSVRDRAMILCMYTSGLRESTVKALRYKDVKHDLSSDVILVPVYPEMKRIHHKACKNNIPYYTFFDPIACGALKSYLRSRETRFGPIGDEEILFAPSAGASHVTQDVAKFKPFAKMEISRIVKGAARNAGLKEWKNVHPHSLRKSFEEALRRRRPDGSMMNEKEVEFLFGHLLAGSQDPYFGSGVRVEGSTVSFDKAMSKKIRDEYSTLQFFPERSLISRDETLAIFNRRFLKMSNWTDGEIDALGDLSELEESKLRELLDRKSMQKLGLNGNSQKVVPMGEVKRFIEEGWEYLSALPSGEAVIRLPPPLTRITNWGG